MDNHESSSPQGGNTDLNATGGNSSSLELSKVKKVLSVKMEHSGAHYTRFSPLGKGSFGEVHSAYDTLLGREVAIKSLKSQYREEEEVINRFLKEARGSAQLEHPNIMPVHEMGVDDEHGIYFTMKKMEGETLREILDHLEEHTAFFEKKYPLNHLLEIFLAVCNGVAFAHSKGVIHRDLKPSNIMTGEFGEVLILDWGLVKQLGMEDDAPGKIQLQMDEFNTGEETLDGAVSGTPNYMSPEQAEGRIKDIDFQSDIYSLGAILYHILTYLPPYERAPIRKLLESVKTGTFAAPRARRPELKIPRELEAICLKAMALYPVGRYRSVEHLAKDIRNYIGNFEVSAYRAPRRVRFWKTCKRNPIKSSVAAAVAVALILPFAINYVMLYGSYKSSMDWADDLRMKGNAMVQEVTSLQDELFSLREERELKVHSARELQLESWVETTQTLFTANYNVAEALYESVPGPFRGKAAVLDGYRDIQWHRIRWAMHRQEYERARETLESVRLRIGDGLDDAQNVLDEIERQVDGLGRLEVVGNQQMDEVMVWPLVEDGSRFLQGDMIARGTLPLTVDLLHKGSYVVMVTMKNGSMLPYPVYIAHGEQKELSLRVPSHIPEGMVYIPAGDFVYGGAESRFYRRQRRSLPAFFIKKYEVTVAEYLEFWTSLSKPNLKREYMSRIRFSQKERRYMDAWDSSGELNDSRLSLEFPVVGITRDAAAAFCTWKGGQAGVQIRLPFADEWEKAARGVDGRKYVWGNHFDENENLTLTLKNKKGKQKYPFWAPPGKFMRDQSIYNVYDMGGNVREMTATPIPGSESSLYQIKGGSASAPATFLPCCYASDTPIVPSDVGFRYVQEIPAE